MVNQLSANGLQILSKDIHEVINTTPDDGEDSISQSGVFLYFSFDLADSTAFKNEHVALWSTVFTCFYAKILESLGVENYKTPNSNYDDSMCVRKLWKLIGDEVLIYVYISDWSQLYNQITNVSETLKDLMDRIAAEVQIRLKEKQKNGCKFVEHCQDIKEAITSTLGIKVTAWIAECIDGGSDNTGAANIIYSPITTTDEKRVDFLGRDIDEGFRIAKYAVKNKIIVSPLLAWLIWKKAEEEEDNRKIVRSNFKIVAFARMKGVWRNRKVPIVMFHQKFEEFMNYLEYDELDLDTFSNVKEKGIKDFCNDERFFIERIEKIFEDVHKKEEAEKIYNKLTSNTDVEIFTKNKFLPPQEFHIACIIFNDEGKILIHKDEDRGYEFGCIKKIFGSQQRSWKEVCEEGYKEKYNIRISVQQCPIPIATYYYKPRNALGLIIMADYAGGKQDLENTNNWEFFNSDDFQSGTIKAVDNFIDNISLAVQIREVLRHGKSGD